MANKKEPDRGYFIAVVSLIVAVLLALLQANGVEVNWQSSLAAYLVLTVASVWSLLRYGIPGLSLAKQVISALVSIAILGSIGVNATLRQYRHEHDNPHLQATDVLLVIPPIVGKPLNFIVSIKSDGSAGSLQFVSGSVIANHLVLPANRPEAEGMFFGMTTQGLDNPAILKPILSFDARTTETWSFSGQAAVTVHQIQEVRNGAVPYFAGKGQYIGRPDLPPFELCFYWPRGFDGPAAKCGTHNSL